jgi:N-acetylglucosamine-6-sulfatase
VARCPELFKGGRVVKEVVANLDIMPTCLEAAGVGVPEGLAGKSFIPLLQGKTIPWRDGLMYEYYWERNFPMTPTMHALRGDRYKYIHYYGIWDSDELYDLQEDPLKQMNQQLFDLMEGTGAMQIPLFRDAGGQSNHRGPKDPAPATFPPELLKPPKKQQP